MIAIAILVSIAAVTASQTPPPMPRASEDMRLLAPTLAGYTDELLFKEIWKRPGLSPRDRSLVTVSALIGAGKAAQLTGHLNLALDNGLSGDQLSALITNAAFYAGWPNAVSAVGVAKDVFAKRNVRLALGSFAETITPTSAGTPLERYAGISDALWRQADLSPRDRALATMAAVIAEGDIGALAVPLARGRAAGLTEVELDEMLLHLSFYLGRPRALAAQSWLRAALGETGAITSGMTILKAVDRR